MAIKRYSENQGGKSKEPLRPIVPEVQSLITCKCGVVLDGKVLPFGFDAHFTKQYGCTTYTCYCPMCKRILERMLPNDV